MLGRLESAGHDQEVELRALEIVGLTDRAGHMPNQLSGGQQQRVALARALVYEPAILLLDEPLSNLDAKLRASMRTELIKLHHQLGRTIIHVTHDQVEAMTMGQRVCIMKDGRMVQIGEPIEVYRNPANTFVAGFLASPPMNLLPARLEDGQGLTAVHGALRLPVPDEFSSSFAAFKGKPVVLGLRPEDMYVPASPGYVPVDVKVSAVESLGPETVLVSEIPGGAEISSRLGREFSARIGSTQRLYIDPRQMYLFDPETTLAIPRNHAA